MRSSVIVLPDTNVIVRYLTKDNEALFTKAKDFFDGVLEGRSKAIVLESVVVECIYVLTKVYRVPREEASRSMINVLRYKGIVNSDKQQLILALELFSGRSIGIVDCILCVKASKPDSSLLSFDDGLVKLYRGLGGQPGQ
jgi:predicted nucleic-acid-binding protein